VPAAIAEKRILDDDTRGALDAVLREFGQQFTAQPTPAVA
jgi:hypothetical protein